MVIVGTNFIFILCGSIVSNVFIQLYSILRCYVVVFSRWTLFQDLLNRVNQHIRIHWVIQVVELVCECACEECECVALNPTRKVRQTYRLGKEEWWVCDYVRVWVCVCGTTPDEEGGVELEEEGWAGRRVGSERVCVRVCVWGVCVLDIKPDQSVWVCEYVSVWVCECVIVWVCDCVSVWVCEWVCDSLNYDFIEHGLVLIGHDLVLNILYSEFARKLKKKKTPFVTLCSNDRNLVFRKSDIEVLCRKNATSCSEGMTLSWRNLTLHPIGREHMFRRRDLEFKKMWLKRRDLAFIKHDLMCDLDVERCALVPEECKLLLRGHDLAFKEHDLASQRTWTGVQKPSRLVVFLNSITSNSERATLCSDSVTICLFVVVYVLATSQVISGRIPTCDSR